MTSNGSGGDPYIVGSVERALALLTLVSDCGSLGAHEAARQIGVAPSTAHRLLATLCASEYLIQGGDRRYRLGPRSLGPRSTGGIPALVRAARPHLAELQKSVGETVHLLALVGDTIHLVDGIESARDLHVTLRVGAAFPVHETAGGKAILAEMRPEEIAARLPSDDLPSSPGKPAQGLPALIRELGEVGRGHAWMNVDQTEVGVSIISASVSSAAREPRAALSIAMPTARFGDADRKAITRTLLETSERLRSHLDLVLDAGFL